jgi:hypothetical protein
MNKWIVQLLSLLVGFGLASCTPTSTLQNGPLDTDLINGEWVFVQGVIDGEVLVPGDALYVPDIQFTEQQGLDPSGQQEAGWRMVGNGGCNGFSGTYQLGENHTIVKMGWVVRLMGCDTIPPNLEELFLGSLQQANHYAIAGGTLTITDKNQNTLTFTRTPATPPPTLNPFITNPIVVTHVVPTLTPTAPTTP